MGRLTWTIAGSIVLAAALGAIGGGFTVAGLPRLAIVGGVLLLAAFYYRHVPNFRLCLSALALVVAFSSGFVVLTYLAARLNPPLVDGWLIHCDATLGFLTIRHWQATLLGKCLTVAYYSLLAQTAATIAMLGLLNKREELEQFLQRMMVAAVIVLACFLLVPAIGPCEVAPSADQAHYLRHFQELRSGTRTGLTLTDVEGLITFPSFHTVWALLLVAACPRRLKPCSVVLNAAVIVATLTTGWHYLTDVLAGIVVYYVACWLLDLQTTVPQRSNLTRATHGSPVLQE
jgi:membrane-associated phospholipid phosphatase